MPETTETVIEYLPPCSEALYFDEAHWFDEELPPVVSGSSPSPGACRSEPPAITAPGATVRTTTQRRGCLTCADAASGAGRLCRAGRACPAISMASDQPLREDFSWTPSPSPPLARSRSST